MFLLSVSAFIRSDDKQLSLLFQDKPALKDLQLTIEDLFTTELVQIAKQQPYRRSRPPQPEFVLKNLRIFDSTDMQWVLLTHADQLQCYGQLLAEQEIVHPTPTTTEGDDEESAEAEAESTTCKPRTRQGSNKSRFSASFRKSGGNHDYSEVDSAPLIKRQTKSDCVIT